MLTKTLHQASFSFILLVSLGVTSVFGLSACGSDSVEKAVALGDQDASGLFKDGTADLDGGAVMIDDIRGFVHADRIIMFSILGHVLFDGQITSITSDDYEATVDVYENGVKTQSGVAVTGTVLNESRITGTLAGTGKASGTFTLTFDPLYSRGATFERIETDFFGQWKNAPSYAVHNTIIQLAFTNTGTYTGSNSQNPSCQYPNGVTAIPLSQNNIYMLSNDVIESNGCAIIGTDYTGFGAVIDGVSVDDTLLYAVTNGTNSVFAVLTNY